MALSAYSTRTLAALLADHDDLTPEQRAEAEADFDLADELYRAND